MNRSIIKSIAMGLVIGTAAFFAPFMILKLICFFFIIGGIMRMFFWRRYHRWGGPQYYAAYADKIRGMSEEEYTAFKNKMNDWQGHCCGHNGHSHCHTKTENK